VAALGANLEIVFQRLAPNDLAAALAFQPQALGAYALLTVPAFYCGLISSEPSHAAFSIGASQPAKGAAAPSIRPSNSAAALRFAGSYSPCA
jgi:hypothetical protein